MSRTIRVIDIVLCVMAVFNLDAKIALHSKRYDPMYRNGFSWLIVGYVSLFGEMNT